MFSRTSNVQCEPTQVGGILQGLFRVLKEQGSRATYTLDEAMEEIIEALQRKSLPAALLEGFDAAIFISSLDIVKDYAEQRKLFGDKCDLFSHEIASIALYSMEMVGCDCSFYTLINRALRSG